MSETNSVYVCSISQAHQLGMFGADYAWILQGGPGSNWWRNASEHCPQLSKAVEGLLLVSSHNSLVGDIPAVSGLVSLLPSSYFALRFLLFSF